VANESIEWVSADILGQPSRYQERRAAGSKTKSCLLQAALSSNPTLKLEPLY